MAQAYAKQTPTKPADGYNNIKSITLELDVEEAKAICAVAMIIGGISVGRAAFKRMHATLQEVGLSYDDQYIEDAFNSTIKFKR